MVRALVVHHVGQNDHNDLIGAQVVVGQEPREQCMSLSSEEAHEGEDTISAVFALCAAVTDEEIVEGRPSLWKHVRVPC